MEEIVKITSPRGVKDTRNGRIFCEVVCKVKDAKFFVKL